jgi:hypothetical protein
VWKINARQAVDFRVPVTTIEPVPLIAGHHRRHRFLTRPRFSLDAQWECERLHMQLGRLARLW